MNREFCALALLLASVICLSGTAPAVGQPGGIPGYLQAFPPSKGYRGDALVLKTMNREELLEFILDSLEEALPEYEEAWTQKTEETGYWDLPLRFKKLTQGSPSKHQDALGAVILYTLLLTEREKAMYVGKYPRAQVHKHLADFWRSRSDEHVNARITNKGIPDVILAYVDLYLKTGKPPTRLVHPSDAASVGPDDWDRLLKQAHIEGGESFGVQGHFGWHPLALGARGSARHAEIMLTSLCRWSVPQDRAVRWAGPLGRPLAELRATGHAAFLPDFSTIEHGHYQWTYITDLTGGPALYPFYLALEGRGAEELPPPFNPRKHPELSRAALGVTRHFYRNHLSADGSMIIPMRMEKYEQQFTFLCANTWDATINKDPEAAAYLSREIQRILWLYRRPFHPYGAIRSWYHPFTKLCYLFTTYHLVKHFGLPEQLPDWSEAQATRGGVTWFPYADVTVHRNPHKVHQIYLGTNADGTGFRSADHLVSNFSPAPWKEGHGMEFLQQFNHYDVGDVGTALNFKSWYFDRFEENFAYYGIGREDLEEYIERAVEKMDVRELPMPDRPSIFGIYNDKPSGAEADSLSRYYWDDGFRVAFAQSGKSGTVHRALFSLGGRVTAILEHAPGRQGRLAPINFWVGNLNAMSARVGWPGTVRWQIQMPERTVPFADYQDVPRPTSSQRPQAQSDLDGEAVCLSNACRWYNVDERVAVALPEPLPLVLDSRQLTRVRDTLYFRNAVNGGEAVIYSGVEQDAMPELGTSVRRLQELPTGWQGITARAPEGYRVFVIARFEGQESSFTYRGKEPEGAPVFSVQTCIGHRPANSEVPAADHRGERKQTPESIASFKLPAAIDAWSEEPHFFITRLEGGTVRARAQYHGIDLRAEQEPATLTLCFLCGTRDGRLQVAGLASSPQVRDAAVLRAEGLTVSLKPEQPVHVAIRGAADRDRMGPHVHITAPVFKVRGKRAAWQPLRGTFTFKADAADRSGIAKVEFYLNNGQLIGTDTEAPYECRHEITDAFCQYVYAVAYDRAGNSRRSFDVPFGDGSIGPSPTSKSANARRGDKKRMQPTAAGRLPKTR